MKMLNKHSLRRPPGDQDREYTQKREGKE